MNDQTANTIMSHLQIIKGEQQRQTKSLERIADALETLVAAKS